MSTPREDPFESAGQQPRATPYPQYYDQDPGSAQLRYGQHPVYGQPPAYGPPPVPGTDGVSIAALVTGILGLGVVPLVIGIVGVQRTGRTGRGGKGLAIAGIVLGGLSTVVWTLLLVFGLALWNDDDFRASLEAPPPMRAGLCFPAHLDISTVMAYEAVPCDDEHGSEVVGVVKLPDTRYPGSDAAYAAADPYCYEAFAKYVGVDYEESELEMTFVFPTEETWDEGDRQVVCYAHEVGGAAVTGTVRDTAR